MKRKKYKRLVANNEIKKTPKKLRKVIQIPLAEKHFQTKE